MFPSLSIRTPCFNPNSPNILFLDFVAIHPSVVNILGLNTATGEFYGLGVTSDDTPVYMVGTSSESFRGITEADWTAAKSACILPTVIPMYPAHGNIWHQVTGASVTTSAGVTYFGKIYRNSNPNLITPHHTTQHHTTPHHTTPHHT